MTVAPLGHFFNVMTNGYGAMPDYAAQLTPADRWAVVAYIKALQLSQDAKPSDAEAGAKIESLSSIAEHEGLPASFVAQWAMPATAVYGTPNNLDNGIPAPLGAPGGNAATQQAGHAAAPAAAPAKTNTQ